MAFHFALNRTEVTVVVTKSLTTAFSKSRPAAQTSGLRFPCWSHHAPPCSSRTSALDPPSQRRCWPSSPHAKGTLWFLTAFGRNGKPCQKTKDLDTKHTAPKAAARALLYQESSAWNPNKLTTEGALNFLHHNLTTATWTNVFSKEEGLPHTPFFIYLF